MEITETNARTELLDFRDRTGMTQTQVSEKTNISRITIVNIEHGKHTPNAMTLRRLEKLVNSIEYSILQ